MLRNQTLPVLPISFGVALSKSVTCYWKLNDFVNKGPSGCTRKALQLLVISTNNFCNYIPLINREWGHYRKISDRGLDVFTERQRGQYIKAEVWDFPVMTEWTRLISYLLYGLLSAVQKKNIIKNTRINFQHSLTRARGHSRSCSLNRNEPQETVSLTMTQFLSLSRQDQGQIQPL